jgi:hypothetical protein
MPQIELIKMMYRIEGERQIKRRTCLINPFDHNGEYTFCGDAWPDTNMSYTDIEAIGEPFHGTFNQITCRKCKAIIRYAKEVIDCGTKGKV